MDYLEQYNQEAYIFDVVQKRFATQGYLNAYDFFFIIIWKANRAKSKVAKNLLKSDQYKSLDDAVRHLTESIGKTPDHKAKLRILISDWKFRLPMASAILSVLYPNDFTVYDVRVCDQLNDFHSLNHKVNFEVIWTGYLAYKSKVELTEPVGLSLRDKDRYLWGKSFSEQLEQDIQIHFSKGDAND
ncbi:hypothetical protein PCCS19_21540 [Paenibacillus sp. CCS19]|uniref:hypothetical protein n=1 Tax=Paenibacillus sp. CCS19 TaxID=3158387 RepID=UPI0025632C32|nr:hypothetical protein [Paenibacillus cellulosilyticus]GMK39100.1 hypothetical protein PCCS19_21540 [Paenibacillus cellulosilyticus]